MVVLQDATDLGSKLWVGTPRLEIIAVHANFVLSKSFLIIGGFRLHEILGFSIVLGLLLLTLAGCSPNNSDPPVEPPFCIDAGALPTSANDGGGGGACEATVAPTYDALYASTFQPTCAKSGSSCHSSVGRQGGIDFSDKERAYSALTQNNVARPREPECSKIVQRVIATDGRVRMPPGANIPVGEQCAIIQWVRNGAQR